MDEQEYLLMQLEDVFNKHFKVRRSVFDKLLNLQREDLKGKISLNSYKAGDSLGYFIYVNLERVSGRLGGYFFELDHKKAVTDKFKKLFGSDLREINLDNHYLSFSISLNHPDIFSKLEAILPDITFFLKELTEHPHDCGDLDPGWNIFHGIVYHGSSSLSSKKERNQSYPHLFKAPLSNHAEYGFNSISTSCSFEVSRNFMGLHTGVEVISPWGYIIEYMLQTNKLYTLTSGQPKTEEYDQIQKADAVAIPLNSFNEHEIAVLNPQALTAKRIFITTDLKNYKAFHIPKSYEEKDILIERLNSLWKEMKANKKEKIKDIKEKERILRNAGEKYKLIIHGTGFQNYVPGEEYIFTIDIFWPDFKLDITKYSEQFNQYFKEHNIPITTWASMDKVFFQFSDFELMLEQLPIINQIYHREYLK